MTGDWARESLWDGSGEGWPLQALVMDGAVHKLVWEPKGEKVLLWEYE